jgi:hypothetical protein
VLAAQLARVARSQGLEVEAEHTAVLLREDLVLVVAPIEGIEYIQASEFFGDSSTETLIGFACIRVRQEADPAGRGIPAGYYELYVLSSEEGDPTATPQPLTLLLEDGAGNRFTMPGALIWSDPRPQPDRSFNRVDVAVNGDDSGKRPEKDRPITVTLWVDAWGWRGCWSADF